MLDPVRAVLFLRQAFSMAVLELMETVAEPSEEDVGENVKFEFILDVELTELRRRRSPIGGGLFLRLIDWPLIDIVVDLLPLLQLSVQLLLLLEQ